MIILDDNHYQIAQQFNDSNINVTISELDVVVYMKDGYPINTSLVQD